MEEKYILGLDIGIASVGWSVVRIDDENYPDKIIDLGVRIFESGEVAKTGESLNLVRRESRGTERLIRRKRHRLERIRKFLDEHNIIDINYVGENFSDYADYSKKHTAKIIDDYYKNNKVNPFLLKVKGLDYSLSNDELLIILLHYGKFRGYKSNREDKSEGSASETGKVLVAIKENNELLQNYRTVSEMLVNDNKFIERIHNSPNEYKMSVTREMVLDDITKVLNKQIELNVISEQFKNEYIEIWGAQRSFAEGPGGNSKYGGPDLINRMVGLCNFTNEKRAPKNAPSVEKFIALQSLANFRYSIEGNTEYLKLTKEQKEKIIDILENQDSINYKKIASIIGHDNIKVKGLKLSKNDFLTVLNKVKKVFNVEKLIVKELTEEQKEVYDSEVNEILLKKVFLKMPTYSYFRKSIKNKFGDSTWNDISTNYELMDKIIELLTTYKTDDTLKEQLKETPIIDNKYYDYIINMPNYKEHIKLSLALIRKLNDLLINDYRYDEAMLKLGYNHFDITSDKNKNKYLPGVMINNDIKNQRVIRSLSQARKIINAVIKEYGSPSMVNVEVARELARTRKERNEIEKLNNENQEKNTSAKEELVKLFDDKFKTIDDVKGYDLLKYRLWIEQDNICAYSLETIRVEELFDNNLVQIDHILPYSRTGNDNYLNKTLVKTTSNQEKGNRTPHEWLNDTDRYGKFESFIMNSNKIPYDKKVNYLYKDLNLEKEKEFKERNLNDTKYISRYLSSFVKSYLLVDKVNMVKGGITAKLRGVWGLNGLTHSLQSESYKLSDVEGDNKTKNRENHLHHALDATIVAVTTPTLIKRVSDYEKYKRYFKQFHLGRISDFNELKKSILYYEKETGSVLNPNELDEFLDDAIKKEFLIKNKSNDYRLLYPVPYPTFAKELKLRLYERDLEKLHDELFDLDNYLTVDDINLVTPTIARSKVSGPLHKETYYGMKEIDNEIHLTERISVNNKRFTENMIQKMTDVVTNENGSNEVVDTLKTWIKGYPDGEAAFKAQGYPKSLKSGNFIKKVRVIRRQFNNKGHVLSNNRVVDIENIHKIGVYTRENSDKLFFVGYDLLTIKKIKNKKTDDLMINIWWGREKNNEVIPYDLFKVKYKQYVELFKNELILIELKNGNTGLCYTVGFTGGNLEIKDILGDDINLLENKLIGTIRSQYQLTISTIKSIKKININTLGKIEKQYQLI